MKKKFLTLIFVFCIVFLNINIIYATQNEPIVIIQHDDFQDFSWTTTKWYRFGTKITKDARYDLVTQADGNSALQITTTATSSSAVQNRIAQYSTAPIGSMFNGNSKLVISARLASNGTTCWSYPCEVGLTVTTNGNATNRYPLFSMAQTASGITTGRFHGSNSTNIASSVMGTPATKWHTYTGIADIVNGQATWTHYIDGIKYGTYSQDVSAIEYNTIYFASWTLGAGTAKGLFDDISAYVLPSNTAIGIASTSVDTDNNILVNFTEPVSGDIKNYIRINGTVVESNRITLLNSQSGGENRTSGRRL